MNFSLADLTFSNDVLGESALEEVFESHDVRPSQNISLQSSHSQAVDRSIFDQAFVESQRNEDSLGDNFEYRGSQNFFETSTEEQSSQVEIGPQIIDNVDIANAAAKEETSAGIVSNSAASILMMSDELTRISTFRQFDTTNHVSFGVKLEKCLDQVQKANLERILKAKMKSDVWLREEVERSHAVLRLYRLRQGENGNPVTLEPIDEFGEDRRHRNNDEENEEREPESCPVGPSQPRRSRRKRK